MPATRDFSYKQEKNVARILGGVQMSNSGATAFSKGDVVAGDVIVECKTKMTECQTFGVSKSWLDTIERERIEMGKRVAAVAISFDTGDSSYFIVDAKTMKRMVELVNGGEW